MGHNSQHQKFRLLFYTIAAIIIFSVCGGVIGLLPFSYTPSYLSGVRQVIRDVAKKNGFMRKRGRQILDYIDRCLGIVPLLPDSQLFLHYTKKDHDKTVNDLNAVGIRYYPYPFSHAFSITSDNDFATFDEYEKYHTIYGKRFGIPIGDSFFLIKESGVTPSQDLSLFTLRDFAINPKMLDGLARSRFDTYHGFNESGPKKELGITRKELLQASNQLTSILSSSPHLYTDHSTTYFIATESNTTTIADEKGFLNPCFADHPESPVYVGDFLVNPEKIRWINPAGYTGESVDVIPEMLSFLTPTVLRNNKRAYLARRNWDHSTAQKFDGFVNNVSSNVTVPYLIENFLTRTKLSEQNFVLYTHLGFNDSKYKPDLYADEGELVVVLSSLSNAHYNLSNSVSENERVWITLPSHFYQYIQTLQNIAPYVRRDGDSIHISSWYDPVIECVQPGLDATYALHGVTFYVDDQWAAKIYLDKHEISSLQRNPPDELTNRPSVTIVNDAVPLTFFNEVDFYYFGIDMTNGIKGLSEPRVLLDTNISYYLRNGNAPQGQFYGELVLEETGTASMEVFPIDFDASETHYFRFMYKKSNPESVFEISFQTEDGNWHNVGEKSGGETDLTWTMPKDVAPNTWHDRVFAFASRNTVTNSTLPAQRIARMRFTVSGNAGDTFHFDRIEFLRLNALGKRTSNNKFLAGRVDPPQKDLIVNIEYGSGASRKQMFVMTDDEGYFLASGIPSGSICDVSTKYEGQIYLPTSGRYVELFADRGDLKISLTLNSGVINPEDRVWKSEPGETTRYLTLAKPHSIFEFGGPSTAAPCFQVKTQINNNGFLDRDRRFSNPDLNVRIGILGSCMLEGAQVATGERVNMQLERILAERTGRVYEVPSAALNTHNLQSSIVCFEDYMKKFNPSVVIYSFGQGFELLLNCWELDAKRQGYDLENPPTAVFMENDDKVLTMIPANPEAAAFVTTPVRTESDDGYYNSFNVDWIYDLYRKDGYYSELMNFAILRHIELLKLFKESVQKHGAKFICLFTPEFDSGIMMDFTRNGISYSSEAYFQIVQKIHTEAGVPLIRISDYIKRYGNISATGWKYDNHLSRAGNRWVAEAVVEYLIQERILLARPYDM